MEEDGRGGVASAGAGGNEVQVIACDLITDVIAVK